MPYTNSLSYTYYNPNLPSTVKQYQQIQELRKNNSGSRDLFNQSKVGQFANLSSPSYLSTMAKTVRSIRDTVRAFEPASPMFSKNQVYSEKESDVTGTTAVGAYAKNTSFTVNVSQLASAQENKGVSLTSSKPTSFSQGENTFAIRIGDTEKDVSFTVNAGETNETSLQKMAVTINAAKTGVTASVVTDKDGSSSFIRLVSEKTGTGSAFILTDKAGGAVAASGANNTASAAQDALFTVDGVERTSQTNTVSLRAGYIEDTTLTLHKAGGGDIKVNIDSDSKTMTTAINRVVESYNKAIEFASDNSAHNVGARRLESAFYDIADRNREALSGVGITIGADRRMNIDSEKLEKAIKSDAAGVRDVFAGSGGVARQFGDQVRQVLAAPRTYAQLDTQSYLANQGYVQNTYTPDLRNELDNLYRKSTPNLLANMLGGSNINSQLNTYYAGMFFDVRA